MTQAILNEAALGPSTPSSTHATQSYATQSCAGPSSSTPAIRPEQLTMRLLRTPLGLLQGRQTRAQQRRLVARCLLLIALGGALFGAAVGWYRGGLQPVAAAIKLPIVTLLTMVVCGPAFVALSVTAGRSWPWRKALVALLVAGARSSLLLAAWAPLLWLGVELGLGYHMVKLSAALVYGIAGLSALSLLLRALGNAPGRGWAAVGLTIVFALVGAQSAWLLRPYIGSPQDREVPLLVNRHEGGVGGAVWRSLHSLGGRDSLDGDVYDEGTYEQNADSVAPGEQSIPPSLSTPYDEGSAR